MDPITIEELRKMPCVVSIDTAARALGMSRTKAYALAQSDEFPCRLLHVGNGYRVPLAELMRLLGVDFGAGSQEGPA